MLLYESHLLFCPSKPSADPYALFMSGTPGTPFPLAFRSADECAVRVQMGVRHSRELTTKVTPSGAASDEVRAGVIADFGYDGGIVRFEILDASKMVQKTHEMQFGIGE